MSYIGRLLATGGVFLIQLFLLFAAITEANAVCLLAAVAWALFAPDVYAYIWR